MNENEVTVVEGIKLKQSGKAFYNPAQKFNRDLSVLVINTFLSEIQNPAVLEAMSATGLRGIRYAKELINNPEVYMNDISEESVKEIKENLILNEIKNVYVTKKDCVVLMEENKSFYNVIDIDPYGSCNVFVDSAFRSIKHNGLLCVTSTDTAVLCSHREKCFSKYETLIVRESSCHEVALRVLLSFISRCAARNNCKIEPLLCVSADYYVRVFLKVIKSESLAKKCFSDNSFYFFCDCFNKKEIKMNEKKINNECKICKKNMKLCGPFWNKSLYNKNFIKKMVENEIEERILGFLNIMLSEEDFLFFYHLNDLCKKIKCSVPPLKKIVNGLLNSNYKVSLTHCKLNSIKTDAPIEFVYFLIFKFNNKEYDKNVYGDYEYSFEENIKTDEIIRKDFYRGKMFSHLGPLKKAE